MLKINEVKQLYLGVQGESQEKTITIDVNPWLVEHPNGTVSIWHKRNGDDAPTPTGAVLDRDSGVLSWTLTGLDTYVAGDGMAEIRLTENSVIKKTREVITTVSESVTGAGGVTGSGWQEYINIVEGYKNAAETAQDAAEDARDLAHEWATYGESSEEPSASNNAKYWAEQAEEALGLAEDAQEAAETAQGLAETAQGKAEDAQEAAETAQGLAETAQGNAEDSAEDAEAWAIGKRGGVDVQSTDPTYHNNAKFYDGEANTAAYIANSCLRNAQTAQGKAETAQGLAEEAQGAAEDARDLAHEWATYGESSETPSATNNAKYWAEQAEDSADDAAQAVQDAIDDTAGDGDTDKLWSANKIYDELALKAPKANPNFTGNSFGMNRYDQAGDSSIAMGDNPSATGDWSVSLGYMNEASGDGSFAKNITTWAAGYASDTSGIGTVAKHKAQHVFGQYNEPTYEDESDDPTDPGTYIEMVGNGTYTNTSNARALDWNGNEKLAGDIYVNCNDDSTGGTALGAEVAGVKSSIGTVPSGKTVEGQISGIESTIGTVPTGSTVMGELSNVKSAIDYVKPLEYVNGMYGKNEYSAHNNDLYKSKQNITAVEQWTANHWGKSNISSDVSMLLNDIENQLNVRRITEWSEASGVFINTNVSGGQTIDITPQQSVDAPKVKYAIISCSPGDVFVINVYGAGSGRAWAWADSSYKRITISGPNVVCVNTKITAPDNAAYLILNDMIGGAIPSYKGDLTKTTIENMQSDIAYLQNKKVEPSDTSFFIVTDNLMNPADESVVIGGYYDKTNTLVTNSAINQSGYIPVVPNQKYTATYRTAYVVWYKQDKTFDSYTEASSFNNNGYIIAPSTAYYGRFMCVATDWASFMVCKGTSTDIPSSYVAYGVYIPEKYIQQNDFNGLKGVAFGTSLTYRAQTTGGYLQYLPSMLGMTFDNQGVGNATILVTQDYPTLDILAKVKNYTGYANKDICILEGFVNDYYRNPTSEKLGTWKDNNETTVCGCVRSALNYILSQNPDITVVLVLDHYGQGSSASTVTNDGGERQYEYYEEIAKVAESMSVPVIKLYETSGMNEHTPNYFLTNDNIHPSALGAKQTAESIYQSLKSVPIKIS